MRYSGGMDRATCLEKLKVPLGPDSQPLQRDSELHQGVFLRNQEDARPRFGEEGFGNNLDPAPYKWRWQEDDSLGLSVNLESCVCCAECSALLHRTPERYRFVVRIALEELSSAIGIKLVAKYSPIPPPGDNPDNPCHFDIMPLDTSVEDAVQQIRRALKMLYSALTTKPKSEAARLAAQAAVTRIERLLQVVPVQSEV